MKRTPWIVLAVIVAIGLAGLAGYAAEKSYQFTGTVQSVTGNTFTVEKSAKALTSIQLQWSPLSTRPASAKTNDSYRLMFGGALPPLTSLTDSVLGRDGDVLFQVRSHAVKYLLVAAGGALGSVARYGLDGFILRLASPYFPSGTFVVNAIGCLIFGMIIGLADGRVGVPRERPVARGGPCGRQARDHRGLSDGVSPDARSERRIRVGASLGRRPAGGQRVPSVRRRPRWRACRRLPPRRCPRRRRWLARPHRLAGKSPAHRGRSTRQSANS